MTDAMMFGVGVLMLIAIASQRGFDANQQALSDAEEAGQRQKDELSGQAQQISKLKGQLNGEERKRKNLQTAFDAQFEAEKQVRTELLGLRGDLSRVAILFDTSASMKIGGRWEDALHVIESFLRHLPMKQCVLISFNSECTRFPHRGLITVDDKGREQLRTFLTRSRLEEGTNTQAALELAYGEKDIRSIILFTDGAPNDGEQLTFEPRFAESILSLCDQHRDIPINVVALGDYFKKDYGNFLLQLSQKTKGNFLGR